MKKMQRFLALLLVLLTILSMTATVWAAGSDYEELVMEMLTYYVYYRDRAETDIARLCAEIGQDDPALGNAWEDVMSYWAWADQQLEVTPDILPDGLPEDDSLCIVVLGYALNPTGSMKNELIGRLEVALASATKYPNAYILCTGGGTASKNSKKTEAGQMAAWLKKHGIDKDRIIIEDDSLSTIQNAQYSCRILAESYPQVQNIAIISSDYHVARGCVYFNTHAVLDAYERSTEPLQILGNAGYHVGNDYQEDVSGFYSGIAQLAGIAYKSQPKPQLSQLTNLEVDGAFTYETGTNLVVTVSAVYHNGFVRDVTHKATLTGVDMSQQGEQLLTVTYAENGTEISKQMLVDIIAPNPAEEPIVLNTKAPEVPSAVPVTTPADDFSADGTAAAPLWPFLLLAALLALLALLLRLKTHVNRS